MQTFTKTLLGAGLLAVAVTSAQAGALRFTIEAPGVQTSQVSGTKLVETFDTLGSNTDFPVTNPYASAVGSYTRTGAGWTDPGTFTAGADTYGGAGGTGLYLETKNQAGGNKLDLDLTGISGGNGGVGYFGFWWSAGDGNNELVITMKDGSTETFLTQSILSSAALQGQPADPNTGKDGHFGNPNYPGAVPFSNGAEVYAFVNIYANNDASRIANIAFRELPGNTQGFESDNHTVIVDLIDRGDQTGENVVPIPATALLLLPGLAGIGLLRRRRGA